MSKMLPQSLSVYAAILVDDVRVDICNHFYLSMTRVALDGFHIATIEFQLVGDTGVTERMEYNMRQSVFFDKFIESTVNHLAFHRTAIAGAKTRLLSMYSSPNRSISSSISFFSLPAYRQLFSAGTRGEYWFWF